MKIAILGWGSLIWNPGDIEIDRSAGENGWFNDGPKLPIEFARISMDGRLTLVIEPNSAEVQVLYAISNFKELNHAILDLAIREGCSKKRIGHACKKGGDFFSEFEVVKPNISRWLDGKEDTDAVIWTDLPKNFIDKTGEDLTEENAVNYLRYTPDEVKCLAEQYIRRAPRSINTRIRGAVERELGWK